MKYLITIRPFVMLLLSILLLSCDKDLEVQTNFPFELEIMPVPKTIHKGETVEIPCKIKSEGNYENTKYNIRYFQYDGSGGLSLGKSISFYPNGYYKLKEKEFTLYYYAEAGDRHSFDIWVSDNFGNEKTISFSFDVK